MASPAEVIAELRKLHERAGRGRWIATDGNTDGEIVCAAMNALPALLECAEALMAVECRNTQGFLERACGRCPACKGRLALAALAEVKP